MQSKQIIAIGARPLPLDNGSATNQANERGRHEQRHGRTQNQMRRSDWRLCRDACTAAGARRDTPEPAPTECSFRGVFAKIDCGAFPLSIRRRTTGWNSRTGAAIRNTGPATFGNMARITALTKRMWSSPADLSSMAHLGCGLGFAGGSWSPVEIWAQRATRDAGDLFEGGGAVRGHKALALPVIHGLLGDAQ